jgi:rhodanese-related sulfurtransferase
VKFIIDNWHLIALALVSGGLLLWPVLRGVATPGLAPTAAVQLINREKAVVEAKLATTVKNKSLPLILVCQTGMRSGRAVAVAKKLGYEQAQSLAGGLQAWKTATLPVEKA